MNTAIEPFQLENYRQAWGAMSIPFAEEDSSQLYQSRSEHLEKLDHEQTCGYLNHHLESAVLSKEAIEEEALELLSF